MDYDIQKYRISYVRESDVFDKDEMKVTNKKDLCSFSLKYLNDSPIESVIVFALDGTNTIIGVMTRNGTPNECHLHPQSVFGFLLSCGASCFALAHNHPGSCQHASKEDWRLTKKLRRVGEEMGLPLIDHIIIAGESAISLRDDVCWE